LRVLRGGAFNNEPRNVRCAVRNRNEPDERNDNIGFRVVVSTFLPRPELSGGASALSVRGEEWRSRFPAALGATRAGRTARAPLPGLQLWSGAFFPGQLVP